jgi:hypothetical protein
MLSFQFQPPALLRHNSDLLSTDPLAPPAAARHQSPVGAPVVVQPVGPREDPNASSVFQMTPNFIEAIEGFVATKQRMEALEAKVAELQLSATGVSKKLTKAINRKQQLRAENEAALAKLKAAEEANAKLKRDNAELNRTLAAQRTENAELHKIKAKRGVDALHAKIAALKEENTLLYGKIEVMGAEAWERDQMSGTGGAMLLSQLCENEVLITKQLETARASELRLTQQLELVRNENSRLAVIIHGYAKKECEPSGPTWADVCARSGSEVSWCSDSDVWSFPADGAHFVRR